MKKFLLLFGALTLSLTSCSSDDSPSGSSDSVLLKKVILTSQDGESKSTVNYTYNGNKIVSIVDETGSMNYTYTGDLITKIEFKLSDGSIEQVNTFTYNSDNKLATFVRVEPDMDWGHKEVYTYNADGTISVQSYGGDSEVQTSVGGTSTIKFVNGEVAEIISITGNQPDRKYTYDDKNNPAKNILGFNKIAFVDGEGTGIAHNEVSETTDGVITGTYTYTYNTSGYPEKSNDKIDGISYSTQYFY
ncbi:hypothetical protein ASE40_11100 [Flavobacterium sp. Root935]|jgi:hypothetical protein|uniref:hypothetical protein n=1 Tax=unclassified Flavobacterium TaxID=196869 RepID=UPI00070974FB|nr:MULTISPECIES: hypothetical protein [unclassified Flavobacterium]KRD59650.1 hypothetical protein ASE40_11100 [Flavobacterium sp. Root935]MDQ1164439.1 hypothetical protein [Flavobacterium sp. SORGH_AS_0622]TDX14360.1 hypothetical protein EDB96_1097 [Flavobacterium sp. S87F.05.LMB.W.Kidney.N]